MAKKYLRYIAGHDRWLYPVYWTDELCGAFIMHIRKLLKYGNAMHFYWCCGLDEAVAHRDFDRIRGWIAEHDSMTRKLLCFVVAYGENGKEVFEFMSWNLCPLEMRFAEWQNYATQEILQTLKVPPQLLGVITDNPTR